jgi:hypothetical protein
MSDLTINPKTGETFNVVRAAWTVPALDQFGMLTYGGRTFGMLVQQGTEEGSDASTCVQDLITNLMHLCDLHGWDAHGVVRWAINNYDEEFALEND